MPNLIDTLLRPAITEGTLEIVDPDGHLHRLGEGAPHVTIALKDRALPRRLALNPKLVLGEAYMDGTLVITGGTLSDLLEIAARNAARYEAGAAPQLAGKVDRMLRGARQFNPVRRAARNVRHHYDIDERLYDTFLDQTRQYSCAYFRSGDETLEEAQRAKMRHITAKLCLDHPGLSVLDIGCGWGGLAVYLAQETGAQVTGLTLSTGQFAGAEELANDAQLADRVEIRLEDYRAATGRYERIVSVGMLEHVGVRHYREYFNRIAELLADDGVALVHAIGRRGPPGAGNPWIRKHIFPGGYTPALSEVTSAIERSGLWVTDIEILRLHYARTLACWFDRFQTARDEVARARGERFCRMWEFYLKGCEMAFRHMGQMVFQVQLAHHPDAVPLTRDYVSTSEVRLDPLARQAA